jgi:hypothetical protein
MKLPAEGPGTPLERPGNRSPREMVAQDRIRLTGLLKENPAFAGFSYSQADFSASAERQASLDLVDECAA